MPQETDWQTLWSLPRPNAVSVVFCGECSAQPSAAVVCSAKGWILEEPSEHWPSHDFVRLLCGSDDIVKVDNIRDANSPVLASLPIVPGLSACSLVRFAESGFFN